MSSQAVRDFIMQARRAPSGSRTAVSLFSGAGLSDLGYEMAGFNFLVQAELDQRRAAIGADNFPDSKWVMGDVRECAEEIVEAYRFATSQRLDLLVATPPCQGMSSSNPSRGKRQTPQAKALEEKNKLILEVIPLARLLRPRIIVAENVRQVLTLNVGYGKTQGTVTDVLRDRLQEYDVSHGSVNVADYGVPQIRRRALVVAVHKEENWLGQEPDSDYPAWPPPSHAEKPHNGVRSWVGVQEWLESLQYEPLDARSKDTARGKHPLHFVPAYGADRYEQVSQIPPCSGQSAYENDTCLSCGFQDVERGLASCPACGNAMRNRPYVERDGQTSLIKGFRSSYRRMSPGRPAYTITTKPKPR